MSDWDFLYEMNESYAKSLIDVFVNHDITRDLPEPSNLR